MLSILKKALPLAAGVLLSVATPCGAVPVEVYPIPEQFHNGSGYTALQTGLDGKVYVGTAMYGGSAHLVQFDPATKTWKSLFDAHAITREPITALDAQGKLHAKILTGSDGVSPHFHYAKRQPARGRGR